MFILTREVIVNYKTLLMWNKSASSLMRKIIFVHMGKEFELASILLFLMLLKLVIKISARIWVSVRIHVEPIFKKKNKTRESIIFHQQSRFQSEITNICCFLIVLITCTLKLISKGQSTMYLLKCLFLFVDSILTQKIMYWD